MNVGRCNPDLNTFSAEEKVMKTHQPHIVHVRLHPMAAKVEGETCAYSSFQLIFGTRGTSVMWEVESSSSVSARIARVSVDLLSSTQPMRAYSVLFSVGD